MKDEHIEKALGVGLGIFGALLLGGVGLIAFGRVAGDAERGRRHSEPPPVEGEVAPERHQNIMTSSAR